MKSLIPLDDPDLLPVLRGATDSQLDPIVAALTDHGRGRISSQLEQDPDYTAYFPRHHHYADAIAAELQCYGGNTLVNWTRGGRGVPYKVLARDLAQRLKANFPRGASASTLEQAIQLKLLQDTWPHLQPEEQEELLRQLGIRESSLPSSLPLVMIQGVLQIGGVSSLRLATALAHSVTRFLLGKSLGAAAGAGLGRGLALLSGPAGWALTGAWTAAELAGPAFRVTLPCVVQIGMLRQIQSMNSCGQGHPNPKTARFCSQCGEGLTRMLDRDHQG